MMIEAWKHNFLSHPCHFFDDALSLTCTDHKDVQLHTSDVTDLVYECAFEWHMYMFVCEDLIHVLRIS